MSYEEIPMKNYAVMYLSIISRLAVLENADRTGDAIESLVNILRYFEGDCEVISTLEAELGVIEMMFYLHNIKKGSNFCGIIHKHEGNDKWYVKKGLIVSLVEVAIGKSLLHHKEILEVIVSVEVKESMCVVTIKDNGDLYVNELREPLEEKYSKILKTYEAIDIQISKKETIGTKVCIYLEP